jgi:hypothetical protein
MVGFEAGQVYLQTQDGHICTIAIAVIHTDPLSTTLKKSSMRWTDKFIELLLMVVVGCAALILRYRDKLGLMPHHLLHS